MRCGLYYRFHPWNFQNSVYFIGISTEGRFWLKLVSGAHTTYEHIYTVLPMWTSGTKLKPYWKSSAAHHLDRTTWSYIDCIGLLKTVTFNISKEENKFVYLVTLLLNSTYNMNIIYSMKIARVFVKRWRLRILTVGWRLRILTLRVCVRVSACECVRAWFLTI